MEIELRSHLVSDTTVNNLVGSRIYPTVLPQAPTFPAVTYQVISAVRTPTMLRPDNLPSKRIQIDVYSESWDDARSVADAIRVALDGFRGTLGSSPGVVAAGIFCDNERTGFEADTALHRVSQDFIVWYEE